jgi:hypothetical protein
MTTVAFDGEILAADTLITSGKQINGYGAKIFANNMFAIAHIGLSIGESKILDGLARADGFNELVGMIQHDSLDDTEFLVFERGQENFAALDAKTGLFFYRSCKRFMAEGSGSQAAMAAMYAGNNAISAVEIASKVDACTGGDITAFNIRTWSLMGGGDTYGVMQP